MLYDYTNPDISAKPNEIKHQAQVCVLGDAERAYQIMKTIMGDSEFQQMQESERSIWIAAALLNVGRMERIRIERKRRHT